MSREPDETTRRRGSALPVLLTAALAMFFLGVLIVLTSGFVLYAGGWLLAFVLLGAVHYLLWGRAFERATEGEREEAGWRERAEHELKRHDARTFDR